MHLGASALYFATISSSDYAVRTVSLILVFYSTYSYFIQEVEDWNIKI